MQSELAEYVISDQIDESTFFYKDVNAAETNYEFEQSITDRVKTTISHTMKYSHILQTTSTTTNRSEENHSMSMEVVPFFDRTRNIHVVIFMENDIPHNQHSINVQEIESQYPPLYISGTIELYEDTTNTTIDVSLQLANIDDSFEYIGVVNKYPYTEYTSNVIESIINDAHYHSQITDSNTTFQISNPLDIPEESEDTGITSIYYFSLFVVSTVSGEYIRLTNSVHYDQNPLLYIDSLFTNPTDYIVHLNLRTNNIYSMFEYSYAGYIYTEPMSESAILELSDPDTQGSFVVAEKTTTAVVNENINNDPQGTLFYVYAITRTVQDITLVSSIAETRIMQILRLSTETESSRVTIKEIEPDYEPLAITGSLNLSENTESKRIDVVIRTENTDDSYIYFGIVKR